MQIASQPRSSTASKVSRPAPSQDQPTVVDLFCGAGGMSLGFHEAGFQTVLGVDFNESAVETFNANLGGARFIDIRQIPRFPRADVVVGGPPCQGFSAIGERNAKDPRNQMWREYMRCLRESAPQVFVMENVPPFLRSREFVQFQKEVKKLGYEVASGVLNAADYGVPETRRRAIVIGSRVGTPSLPPPTHRNPEIASQLPAWKTLKVALQGLQAVPDGKNHHLAPAHDARTLDCIRKGRPWSSQVWQSGGAYQRLSWEEPSPTIRTGVAPSQGRFVHPEQDRGITPREAARIQSFPDDFEFHGTKTEVLRQIGNAVPPALAAQLGTHVKSLLQGSTKI